MSAPNPYMVVEIDRPRGFVRMTRTDVPYPSMEDMPSSAVAALRVLPADAPQKLLIDFRNGPPARNDPEFEAASVRTRQAILGHFPVSAILVRTAVGKLQVNRLAKNRGETANVFFDEAEAIEFLRKAGK